MNDVSTVAPAEVRLRELLGSMGQHAGFAEAMQALRAHGDATFDGVWGSACALLGARLVKRAGGQLSKVDGPELQRRHRDTANAGEAQRHIVDETKECRASRGHGHGSLLPPG